MGGMNRIRLPIWTAFVAIIVGVLTLGIRFGGGSPFAVGSDADVPHVLLAVACFAFAVFVVARWAVQRRRRE